MLTMKKNGGGGGSPSSSPALEPESLDPDHTRSLSDLVADFVLAKRDLTAATGALKQLLSSLQGANKEGQEASPSSSPTANPQRAKLVAIKGISQPSLGELLPGQDRGDISVRVPGSEQKSDSDPDPKPGRVLSVNPSGRFTSFPNSPFTPTLSLPEPGSENLTRGTGTPEEGSSEADATSRASSQSSRPAVARSTGTADLKSPLAEAALPRLGPIQPKTGNSPASLRWLTAQALSSPPSDTGWAALGRPPTYPMKDHAGPMLRLSSLVDQSPVEPTAVVKNGPAEGPRLTEIVAGTKQDTPSRLPFAGHSTPRTAHNQEALALNTSRLFPALNWESNGPLSPGLDRTRHSVTEHVRRANDPQGVNLPGNRSRSQQGVGNLLEPWLERGSRIQIDTVLNADQKIEALSVQETKAKSLFASHTRSPIDLFSEQGGRTPAPTSENVGLVTASSAHQQRIADSGGRWDSGSLEPNGIPAEPGPANANQAAEVVLQAGLKTVLPRHQIHRFQGVGTAEFYGQYAKPAVNQIVQGARLMQREGGASFEIRLKPEFLGDLRIDTVLRPDQSLAATISVQQPSVKTLLEAHLATLLEQFDQAGLKFGSVTLRDMGADAGPHSHERDSRGGAGGQAHDEESHSRSQTRRERPMFRQPPADDGRLNYFA